MSQEYLQFNVFLCQADLKVDVHRQDSHSSDKMSGDGEVSSQLKQLPNDEASTTADSMAGIGQGGARPKTLSRFLPYTPSGQLEHGKCKLIHLPGTGTKMVDCGILLAECLKWGFKR